MIHHDIPWNLMKSLYFQTHPGLFRSIQFWSIPIPTATSGLRFRRQATQPGKMSPERSQQVGLKMAIASSLLYMFFTGKMRFFFNMLKTTTTIGVHTLCSDKPIWSCNPCSSPHWVVSSDFLLETSRYQGGPATLSQECQGHPKIQSQMGFK